MILARRGARVKITFQKELFLEVMPEFPELFMAHYDEIALDKAQMPLNPAWKQYVNLESAGVLHVLTMRADGKLVGYFFNLAYPHLHYSDILCSFSDMFYIARGYRRGGWGYIKMLLANEAMLRDIGVQKIFVMTKIHKSMVAVMKRLKYTAIEYINSKWL